MSPIHVVDVIKMSDANVRRGEEQVLKRSEGTELIARLERKSGPGEVPMTSRGSPSNKICVKNRREVELEKAQRLVGEKTQRRSLVRRKQI